MEDLVDKELIDLADLIKQHSEQLFRLSENQNRAVNLLEGMFHRLNNLEQRRWWKR